MLAMRHFGCFAFILAACVVYLFYSVNLPAGFSRNITIVQKCSQEVPKPFHRLVNGYHVFLNLVPGTFDDFCSEMITLTTLADVQFLDNLPVLTQRWQSFVSVAIYTPGDDFFKALEAIAYWRACSVPEIRKFVAFHLVFDENHIPKSEEALTTLYKDDYNCRKGSPIPRITSGDSYRKLHNLSFPINVLRNVARDAAQTHFIFPSDIELYPSPNFVPKFYEMVRREPNLFAADAKNVFVLAVFEIEKGHELPATKSELQALYKQRVLFPFHEKICRSCHRVINEEQWLEAEETEGLGVFAAGKRQGEYGSWEPFFVSTKTEPLFDERQTWEGQGDKLPQAYSLCVQNYDFLILDNAFLVHKPGIKQSKPQDAIFFNVQLTATDFRRNTIGKEIDAFFGRNHLCRL